MVASLTAGRVAVIIGATGNQGGSVLRHLLASSTPYQLKAVSRSAARATPKMKALDEAIQIVEADTGSRSDLDRIFKGANIVFAVTDFWSDMDAAREYADGKRMIDAALDAGSVDLFIWSGLESVSTLSKGELTEVKHFDSKAAITEYAKSSGIALAVVEPGCFMSNFVGGMGPSMRPDGTLTWTLPVSPDTIISLMDASGDFGAWVREAIESPAFGPGSNVLACSEELTLDEMARQWSEVKGVNVKYEQMPMDDYLARMPPGAGHEMLQTLQFFERYGYFGRKDVKPSQQNLAVPVTSWAEFCKKTKWEKLGV